MEFRDLYRLPDGRESHDTFRCLGVLTQRVEHLARRASLQRSLDERLGQDGLPRAGVVDRRAICQILDHHAVEVVVRSAAFFDCSIASSIEIVDLALLRDEPLEFL